MTKSLRAVLPFVLGALGFWVVSSDALHAQSPPFGCQFLPRVQIGSFNGSQDPPQLNEASGLVMSRKNADVFWAHNDNGDMHKPVAMSRTGTLLGQWWLAVADGRDVEDIALGPGPVAETDYLYLGDIGGNRASCGNYCIWGCGPSTPEWCQGRDPNAYAGSVDHVWRAVEPSVSASQPFVTVNDYPADTITLAFPDSFRGQYQDVETLMVDPLNGDIYLVTKRTSPAKVFRAPYPQSTTVTNVMEFVIDLPWGGDSQATGGDISADGRLIIVRRYGDAFLWERAAGQTIAQALAGPYCQVGGLGEQQGEAVAFDVHGSGTFYTTSEGSGQVPIYRFSSAGLPATVEDLRRTDVRP